MNFKPNIYRLTPEKIRSACWLTLALMLFLASSFAESSWSDISSEPESATAGAFYLKDSQGAVQQAVHVQSAVGIMSGPVTGCESKTYRGSGRSIW